MLKDWEKNEKIFRCLFFGVENKKLFSRSKLGWSFCLSSSSRESQNVWKSSSGGYNSHNTKIPFLSQAKEQKMKIHRCWNIFSQFTTVLIPPSHFLGSVFFLHFGSHLDISANRLELFIAYLTQLAAWTRKIHSSIAGRRWVVIFRKKTSAIFAMKRKNSMQKIIIKFELSSTR